MEKTRWRTNENKDKGGKRERLQVQILENTKSKSK